jgi:hypothetical protein
MDMPNPLRKVAAGKPLYTSWVNVWNDDVSGNVSKMWNVHNNMSFTHANLPRQTLTQERHIHFLSTSQYAKPVEQTMALEEALKCVDVQFVYHRRDADVLQVYTHLTDPRLNWADRNRCWRPGFCPRPRHGHPDGKRHVRAHRSERKPRLPAMRARRYHQRATDGGGVQQVVRGELPLQPL